MRWREVQITGKPIGTFKHLLDNTVIRNEELGRAMDDRNDWKEKV